MKAEISIKQLLWLDSRVSTAAFLPFFHSFFRPRYDRKESEYFLLMTRKARATRLEFLNLGSQDGEFVNGILEFKMKGI